MITPELIEYVKGQLLAGQTPENLRSALTAQGWGSEDINEALTNTGNFPVSTPVMQNTASSFPKSNMPVLATIFSVVFLLVIGGVYTYERTRSRSTPVPSPIPSQVAVVTSASPIPSLTPTPTPTKSATPSPSPSTSSSATIPAPVISGWKVYVAKSGPKVIFDYPPTWTVSESVSGTTNVDFSLKGPNNETMTFGSYKGPSATSFFAKETDVANFNTSHSSSISTATLDSHKDLTISGFQASENEDTVVLKASDGTFTIKNIHVSVLVGTTILDTFVAGAKTTDTPNYTAIKAIFDQMITSLQVGN